MDCLISFYFQHGRFLGSQKLISIPKGNLPYFLKTDMPISPVDLYKALVSVHALPALNIHFGRNKYTSQAALGEYLNNLAYQALSQENDKTFMSFSELGLLVNDLLEQFVLKENAQIVKSSAISEEIRKQLKTDFKLNLSPELKIQRGKKILKLNLNQLSFQLH